MKRLIAFIGFLIFYAGEVVKSNVRVAYDVITPRHRMRPAVIAVDLEGMTERQMLFMANFITMTPGTLGLSVSPLKKKLYIHAMYIDEGAEVLSRELSETYGKRVRDVF